MIRCIGFLIFWAISFSVYAEKELYQLDMDEYYSKLDQKAPSNSIRLIVVGNLFGNLEHGLIFEDKDHFFTGKKEDIESGLTGEYFLNYYGLAGRVNKYIYSSAPSYKEINFFGEMGGYKYIKTMIDRLKKSSYKKGYVVLDAGNSSFFPYNKKLGVELIKLNKSLGIESSGISFGLFGDLDKLELFNLKERYNKEFSIVSSNIKRREDNNYLFSPYYIKNINGIKVGYIALSNPKINYFNPPYKRLLNTSIEIKKIQELINTLREDKGVNVVVLSSYMDMPFSKKITKLLYGIDVILSYGDTYITPYPKRIILADGKPCLTLSVGKMGKFISVLDLGIKNKSVSSFDFNVIPVMGKFIKPNKMMEKKVNDFKKKLVDKKNKEGIYKPYFTNFIKFTAGFVLNSTLEDSIAYIVKRKFSADIVIYPWTPWYVPPGVGKDFTEKHILDFIKDSKYLLVKDVQLLELKRILEKIYQKVASNNLNYRDLYGYSKTFGIKYQVKMNNPMGKRVKILKIGMMDVSKMPNDKTFKVVLFGSNLPGAKIRINPLVFMNDYIKEKGSIKLFRKKPEVSILY